MKLSFHSLGLKIRVGRAEQIKSNRYGLMSLEMCMCIIGCVVQEHVAILYIAM